MQQSGFNEKLKPKKEKPPDGGFFYNSIKPFSFLGVFQEKQYRK